MSDSSLTHLHHFLDPWLVHRDRATLQGGQTPLSADGVNERVPGDVAVQCANITLKFSGNVDQPQGVVRVWRQHTTQRVSEPASESFCWKPKGQLLAALAGGTDGGAEVPSPDVQKLSGKKIVIKGLILHTSIFRQGKIGNSRRKGAASIFFSQFLFSFCALHNLLHLSLNLPPSTPVNRFPFTFE